LIIVAKEKLFIIGDDLFRLSVTCHSILTFAMFQMEAHKETMGKYCCHLLADYLNVISGQSLGGIGLKRLVLV
jgi:hypothetical protein